MEPSELGEISPAKLHSYPSIYTLGHGAVSELLLDSVVVEEKLDGSQFSFGIGDDGVLRLRSKSVQIHLENVPKQFAKAVDGVLSIKGWLRPGWTYRTEAVTSPKHNVLTYNRAPQAGFVVFDVNTGHEQYLRPQDKYLECQRLGLECVPLFFEGVVTSVEQLKSFLEKESFLGGPKIEGFVVKNYTRFGKDKKALLGKYVSEAFKEKHGQEWGAARSPQKDIHERLKDRYVTPARWQKSIQRLRDADLLTNTPADIGPLLKEVQADFVKEELEDVQGFLWAWAKDEFFRSLARGFPQYYKTTLLEAQPIGTKEVQC